MNFDSWIEAPEITKKKPHQHLRLCTGCQVFHFSPAQRCSVTHVNLFLPLSHWRLFSPICCCFFFSSSRNILKRRKVTLGCVSKKPASRVLAPPSACTQWTVQEHEPNRVIHTGDREYFCKNKIIPAMRVSRWNSHPVWQQSTLEPPNTSRVERPRPRN